ncbi:CPBP family intramembrane glutamic endopeptidase [Staphylococcus pasteuri]|jgi:membrane protease YdiL (CAAX protease family)|uniref:CPBP family intramembrane glutamic endopeptidase n=1 Tax=Staphylococcus pasteuri TaxID=45972 RepID=UPI000E6796ED|nr:CPBP family intramembrane glutamic endopeptidase [Staphylococcus pasteuri]RIO54566.1 CPBP family intramembrane metalloprotease [Staphylococcus pasteuri]
MDILKINNLSKLESILLCIVLTILAGISINFGGLLVLFLPIQDLGSWQLIIPAIFMIIGFIILPRLITDKIIGFESYIYQSINFYRFIAYIIIVFTLFLIWSVNIENIIQPFIVAICEEYLFRGIFFGILVSKFSKIKSFLIGSLIFALLLHLNGNFIENLLIKFPSGILLYILADKLGLQESILFHWVHNIIVSEFI